MKVPLIISNHSDLENIANDFNAKFVHIDTFKTDKSIVVIWKPNSDNSKALNFPIIPDPIITMFAF